MKDTFDIGLDKRPWGLDGPVHVAFRGEVDHKARFKLEQKTMDERFIANIALNEVVPSVLAKMGKTRCIACISKKIQVDDGIAVLLTEILMNKVGAYKSRSTCDQPYFFHGSMYFDDGFLLETFRSNPQNTLG
jgi:hypothetical protein